MRSIEYGKIADAVRDMCLESNYDLPDDVRACLNDALTKEESPLGRSILRQCLDNAAIAGNERVPICQDTGLAVFFVRLGADVRIEGGILPDAVNEGVKRGYREGCLRKSTLDDPLFARANTGDNAPAVIHLELVPGDGLEITMAPKGGGAENMSRLKMLPPSAGEQGVIDFVAGTVVEAGGNPCPPTVVGVGIGGTFERVALLAKKALLWPLGRANDDPRYAALEQKILRRINDSGVGPQGLGGSTTSLWVHIEHAPCHLASLPAAVNINCHAHRHAHRAL
ncbi:MAG TPA: fumarate hydratase [Candidatus Edwardsbacteria bacterium]|nr:fumarate hydratase [Candidatus Edwardsbacteria bacterium]